MPPYSYGPRLNVNVSQKQILTPGLVQMVSILALNKLELSDMINAELTENPVLEELENSVPLLDEVSAREEKMDRDSSAATQEEQALPTEEKDPFEEIDFGSFFKEYLDPGLRTSVEMEDSEKPSFENFLSKPTTLSDHLLWQLGSLHVKEDVHRAAELVIGNLNEEGYLTATEDELLGLMDEDMGFARSEPNRRCRALMSPRPAFQSPMDGTLTTGESDVEPEMAGEVAVAEAEEETVVHATTADFGSWALPVLTWCRRAPVRRAYHSAAMHFWKPSIWSSSWILWVSARAIFANACWRSF